MYSRGDADEDLWMSERLPNRQVPSATYLHLLMHRNDDIEHRSTEVLD